MSLEPTRLIATFGTCVFLACATALAAPTRAAPPTRIIHDNVVTMDDAGNVFPDASVLIRDGRIAEVLPHGGVSLQAKVKARTVDGHGAWLIPGLIDAHIHYDRDGELTSYLRHGVTTVLSLGRPESAMTGLPKLRAEIAAGRFPGPRVYATGPIISNQVHFEDPAAARAFVRDQAQRGRGFVKIYNGTSRTVFDAVVAEARAQGLGVFGHMPRTMAPGYVVSHGLNVLAHMEELFFTTLGGTTDQALPGLTPDWKPQLEKIDPLFELMKANGVAIIPNLVASYGFSQLWVDPASVFTDPELAYLPMADVKEWCEGHYAKRAQINKRMLRERLKLPLIEQLTWRAAQKGILLVAGTDSPIPPLFPGKSLHEELRLLVQTGLTPTEALATATRNAGTLVRRFVDHQACIGVVHAGCEADLLLLSGDPTRDIRNVDAIEKVMADGRWYSPRALARRRAGGALTPAQVQACTLPAAAQ
jgi:imidazolonepropionase-like amidohydrolase